MTDTGTDLDGAGAVDSSELGEPGRCLEAEALETLSPVPPARYGGSRNFVMRSSPHPAALLKMYSTGDGCFWPVPGDCGRAAPKGPSSHHWADQWRGPS